MMAEDRGYAGRFQKKELSLVTMEEIYDVVGPEPHVGAHWVMVDLDTRLIKWYQAAQRKRTFTRKRKK